MANNPFEISDDVLRNISNLNKENEPNWISIKKWLSIQLIHYQNAASLGTHLMESKVREMQGVSVFLFNLVNWTENPEDELKLREASKTRGSKTDPIKV